MKAAAPVGLLNWIARYDKREVVGPWGPIVTRLYVRAATREAAERLAPVVFEQAYGAAPERLGFILDSVERAV